MKITPIQHSILQGDSLSFSIENAFPEDFSYVQPYFSVVNEDYDDFRMISSSKLRKESGRLIFDCPFVCKLEEGVYILSWLRFVHSTKGENVSSDIIVDDGALFFSPLDYGNVLFEIRKNSSKASTEDQLHKSYNSILQKRDSEFLKGFGRPSNTPEVKSFECVVFVKNCLMSSKMRVGQYGLIPIEGLSCSDIISLMNAHLANSNIPPLSNIEEAVERAKIGQPTFAAIFPNVYAITIEDCFDIIESEIERLCNILSLHRSSYASIISSAVKQQDTLDCFYKIYTPTYRGNLCKESVPEEYRMIKERANQARSNEKIQLYTALYKECLLEKRREFAYFRFWNLLETISRSKNYVGNPLKDRHGNTLKNKKGHLRVIQDQAEEIVFEYLRATKIINLTINSGLQFSDIEEQIPIWYRNRNCVVHGGGCFPQNTDFCDTNKSKYLNCNKAYSETLSQNNGGPIGIDGYLRNLREVVMIAVCNEFPEIQT